jgi:hypothetical protein
MAMAIRTCTYVYPGVGYDNRITHLYILELAMAMATPGRRYWNRRERVE